MIVTTSQQDTYKEVLSDICINVVTPFDALQPKTPCYTQTSQLYVLWNGSYCQPKLYIAGIGIFHLFGSCDLNLDRMTFIYERDPHSWRYTICTKMNFLHPRFPKLLSDRQTDRHTDRQTDRQTGPKLYTTPLRVWSMIEFYHNLSPSKMISFHRRLTHSV